MWQSRIVLSNKFKKYKTYLENKLSKIPKLNFVIKTSVSSVVFELACEKHNESDVKAGVNKAICSLVLVKIKLNFLLKNLSEVKNTLLLSAYLACLVGYKSQYEHRVLENILYNESTYNIESLLLFRMGRITSHWMELRDFSDDLVLSELDNEDFYHLIVFFLSISYAKECSLYLSTVNGGSVITNLTTSEMVQIEDLYTNADQNIIAAILLASPKELLVEEQFYETPVVKLLRQVVKVKRI